MQLHAASNDKDRATLFNQYFHSVFNQVNSDIPELDNLIPHPNPISHFEISEAEVYDALTQLDPTKAIGLDGSYWSKNTQELCTVSLSAS